MNIGEYKTQLAALKSSATNALVGGIVLGVMAFAALLAKNIGIFLFSCVLAAALFWYRRRKLAAVQELEADFQAASEDPGLRPKKMIDLYELFGVKQHEDPNVIRQAIMQHFQAGTVEPRYLDMAKKTLLNPEMRGQYDNKLQQNRMEIAAWERQQKAYEERLADERNTPKRKTAWLWGAMAVFLCLAIFGKISMQNRKATAPTSVSHAPATDSTPVPKTSETSTAALSKHGWLPDTGCNYLSNDFPTRPYHDSGDGEYWCSSDTKDIGDEDPTTGRTNHVAFYGIGTQTEVQTLKLVVNYHNPGDSDQATAKMISSATLLAGKATGRNKLPEKIVSALNRGSNARVHDNGFTHEVIRKDWPRGNGYEVHYLLTK